MAEEQKHHLVYTLEPHPEGITTAQLKEREAKGEPIGGCDSVLLCSVLHDPPDGDTGALSVMFIGVNGHTSNPMSPDLKFKIWAMLAADLSEEETLGVGRRQLCTTVHHIMKEALAAAKAHT